MTKTWLVLIISTLCTLFIALAFRQAAIDGSAGWMVVTALMTIGMVVQDVDIAWEIAGGMKK